MSAIRRRVARALRSLADHIHVDSGFRASGLHLRFVDGVGMEVDFKNDGCLLWYLADEYDKAFAS